MMRELRYHSVLVMAFGLVGNMVISPDVSASQPRVGVLIGSYGDVDAPDELKELVINTLTDPDVLPVPGFLSKIIAELGYKMTKDEVLEEYAAIGGKSNMRYNTRLQADRVAEELRKLGYDAKGYSGFTMTFPYVKEALNEAQSDGVEKLVVFYEGAQFSQVTAFIVFRHVEEYLAKHPEWKVQVVGVKSFSDDPRFAQQLVDNLERTWQEAFPGAPAEDVCIFLPMHGNVLKWLEKGDPYLDQVMRNVEHIKASFPKNHVSFGFQNHDELPFVKWTMPDHEEAIGELVNLPCSKVLSSGQVSFTVDSLETLYDHGIGERDTLLEKAAKAGVRKDFALVPMFNSDPRFVELLSELAAEAMEGQGDLIPLGVGELKKIDLQP